MHIEFLRQFRECYGEPRPSGTSPEDASLPPDLRERDAQDSRGVRHAAEAVFRRHPDVNARCKVDAMAAEYQRLPVSSTTSAKVKRWLDFVARIPFDRTSPGFESDSAVSTLQSVEATMDDHVRGMHAAKTAVKELAVRALIARDRPVRPRALLLEGPPGCGKTTFLTRTAGPALRRPTRVINLGGARDASFLFGHDFTYEASRPGRLIDEWVASGVRDPLIVLDEIDKVSDTPGGREIVHFLMCLTDPVQNTAIVDNYLNGVSVDLSHVLFAFTCNDAATVDPVLLDRLRVVAVPGMTDEDKYATATDYSSFRGWRATWGCCRHVLGFAAHYPWKIIGAGESLSLSSIFAVAPRGAAQTAIRQRQG